MKMLTLKEWLIEYAVPESFWPDDDSLDEIPWGVWGAGDPSLVWIVWHIRKPTMEWEGLYEEALKKQYLHHPGFLTLGNGMSFKMSHLSSYHLQQVSSECGTVAVLALNIMGVKHDIHQDAYHVLRAIEHGLGVVSHD